MAESLTKRLGALRQSHLQLAQRHVAELERLQGEADAVSADCRQLLGPARKNLRSLQSLVDRAGAAPAAAGGGAKRPSGCTNKKEVVTIVEELLAANDAVPRGDLMDLVGERLRGLGRNLKMFASIFPKALADERFEVTPDGECRLAGGPGAADQRQARHMP